jgi:hypothetical protein
MLQRSSSNHLEHCKYFLFITDFDSVRPHIEDDGIGAWNINISSKQEMVARWWMVENSPENKKKVSFDSESSAAPSEAPLMASLVI